MATYPEQRADGSVWEIEYDPTTDAILGERMISGPTGSGNPAAQSPQNAVLESWMAGQAQQQAYSQAMKAADDAYRQAALQGQNEASARQAAISAGSNALSGYISLLNAYGGSGGLDVNAIASFIKGEGPLNLPTGPTLEGRKTIAELQANPRDIFKLAAYQAGVGGAQGAYSGFGASANEQEALAGFPGGVPNVGGGGGMGGPGGMSGAGGGGPAIEQARAELVKASGGHWQPGTYGPGTPGQISMWATADPQTIANEYFRLTGKTVPGFTPTNDPLARFSPEDRAALQHIFNTRPDIAAHFAANPEVTGARGGSRYMVTDPNEMMATWGIWNAPEVQQAGGLQAYAKLLGWNGQLASPTTPTVGGTSPTPDIGAPPSGGQMGVFPGETGAPRSSTSPMDMGRTDASVGPGGWNPNLPTPTLPQGTRTSTPTSTFAAAAGAAMTPTPNASQYNQSLYNLPQFQELRNRFGSAPSNAFPFAPQVPLPQPNEVPLGYMSQQGPFNRSLLEAAYSTAGLSKDVYEEPYRMAERAFGGGLGY